MKQFFETMHELCPSNHHLFWWVVGLLTAFLGGMRCRSICDYRRGLAAGRAEFTILSRRKN